MRQATNTRPIPSTTHFFIHSERTISSRTFVLVLGLLALGSIASAQAYPYVLTDLGTLTGQPDPLGQSINDNGTIVGWFFFPTLGWIYTPGSGLALVGTLPGDVSSTARDVNNAGQIVGSSWLQPIQQPGHAYRSTPGAGLLDLGTLGGTTSEAWAINDAGQVVGDSFPTGSTGASHGFLYTDGIGMVDITPNTSAGAARDISRNGQVTGYMVVGLHYRAFRYVPGAPLSDIAPPIGFLDSYGFAINDAGQIAGSLRSIIGSNTLFRWTPGIGYEILGGTSSEAEAWAINASGAVVGQGKPTGSSFNRAVFYSDATGLVDLNTLVDPLTNWTLLWAFDINDAGQIVGHGSNGSGQTRAFRLDPTPAPLLTVVGSGCGGGLLPPTLASTLPHMGQQLTITVAGVQPGAIGQLLASLVPPAPTVVGGGCTAYIDVANYTQLAFIVANANGTWSPTYVVPYSPAFLGANLMLQAVTFPGTGPFGFDLTNGLDATIGY